MRTLGTLIWNTSEFLHIPLGRFAPKVLGWMCGTPPKKVD